jgi:hypothetical protein
MFWQSVGGGFLNLFDWHVLVGALGVSFITLLHPMLIALITGGGEKRFGIGVAFAMFGGPLFQVIAVSGFILLCLPAIVGTGGFTPSQAIGVLFWPVFKAGMWAMLIVLLICFIPIVGKIVSDTPGVPVFLQGILVIKPIYRNLYRAINGERLPNDVFPGFWYSLGYIVIGVALCYAMLLVVFLIGDQIKKRRDPFGHMTDRLLQKSDPPTSVKLFTMMFGPAIGVVPLLMYGKYLSLQLQAM